MACYRRQSNTYAKEQPALQGRLDAYWVLHNFIRPHFTTKQVPAVSVGIVDHPLSWDEIFRIQYVIATSTWFYWSHFVDPVPFKSEVK